MDLSCKEPEWWMKDVLEYMYDDKGETKREATVGNVG